MEPTLDSLTATRVVAKGDATCAGGGSLLEIGLDSNRNNTLDAAEVTTREYLQCLTAPRLRALHASPDAPPVNIRVNGAQALANVDYGQGSGFVNVTESTRVEVEAIIPGGNAVVLDRRLALDFSTDYTVLAVGEVADPIDTLVINNPGGRAIAAGNLRAQVVHAAPNAPAVDVYVTAPGAALAGSTPVNVGALAYGEYTGRAEVPAGDYRIRVTAAGNPGAVVYDSGTLALAAGADLLIAAIENTGPGAAPIQLVALDGQGSARHPRLRDSGLGGGGSCVARRARGGSARGRGRNADQRSAGARAQRGLPAGLPYSRGAGAGQLQHQRDAGRQSGRGGAAVPAAGGKGQRAHRHRHGLSRQHARAAAAGAVCAPRAASSRRRGCA